ncbi:10854_t:CDS:2, partial [Entrophospora sp. SA101]
GLKSGWMPEGEQPLRKKGQGRSIHVYEFGESVPHEARVMMNPGKNFDGW